jgi:uncharacterized protein (TIGR02117 family)
MRRWGRRLALALTGIVTLLAIVTLLTARTSDPALWPATGRTIDVFIVSHGYHAGVVLPREVLAEQASRHGHAALAELATRFQAFPWIEIGWGDEGFYREVPTVAALNMQLAFRALFRPGNLSVLHVVGLQRGPELVFPSAEIVRIGIGEAGLARLLARVDATFARGVDGRLAADLGKGLYGPSLFYRAVGTFNILNVCNHWVAGLLDAAGLPTAPVLATLPSGLFLDLRWRAGLTPITRTAVAAGG